VNHNHHHKIGFRYMYIAGRSCVSFLFVCLLFFGVFYWFCFVFFLILLFVLLRKLWNFYDWGGPIPSHLENSWIHAWYIYFFEILTWRLSERMQCIFVTNQFSQIYSNTCPYLEPCLKALCIIWMWQNYGKMKDYN
jgi:hypothetical protein